jgi:hypothetical protein
VGTLIKAGFFPDGYGSDFVNEGIVPNGNKFLTLEPLDFEEVVKKAVEQFA